MTWFRPRNVLDEQVIMLLPKRILLRCSTRDCGTYHEQSRYRATLRASNIAYLIQRHLDEKHAASRIEFDMTYWFTSRALSKIRKKVIAEGQRNLEEFP